MHIIVWHNRRPNAAHKKKYEASVPKTIDKYCQKNHAVARNLRKMHEISKKIAELTAATEKLKEENAKLRTEKSDVDKDREQIERVTGNYFDSYSSYDV